MTDIDALISTLRYWAERSSTFMITREDINRLLDALTAERTKVAELEAEVKIAEAKGWRDAVTCVQYCAANWSQDCRSEAERNALEDAARELVNELVAASPGDWVGMEWKTAQDYGDIITKLETDAARWREVAGELAEALEIIDRALACAESDANSEEDMDGNVYAKINVTTFRNTTRPALVRYKEKSGR